MGPSAIRYAGLNDRLHGLGYQVLDWGDVETAVLEAIEETDSTARYLPEIKAACGRVARLVGLALEQGALPLDKMVTKRYGSLDEIHEGVRALERGEIFGRSIMVYAQPD